MAEGTQGPSQGIQQLDLDIAERVKLLSAEDLVEVLPGRAFFVVSCTRKRKQDNSGHAVGPDSGCSR